MNNFKTLTLIFSILLATQASADQLVPELNFPEFALSETLPSPDSLPNEFRGILASINNLSSQKEPCPSSIISSLNKLSSTRGFRDEVHLFKGACKELEGDFDLAINEYKSSLKLKHSNPSAITRLSLLKASRKEYKDALNLAEEAKWLKAQPIYMAPFISAYCHSKLGNVNDAKKLLGEIDKIAPEFGPSLMLRKEIINQQLASNPDPNKINALRAEYNALLPKLIQKDPDNKAYSLDYAKILLSQGHPLHSPKVLLQGINLVKKFSRQANSFDEQFLLLEIQFLEKQGRFAEAVYILSSLSEHTNLTASLEFKKKELEDKLIPKDSKE